MIDVPLRLLACTTIGFAPYSEKQLRDILIGKARAAGFSKHRASEQPFSVARASALSSAGPVMPINNEVSSAASSEYQDFSADLDAFAGIMLIALPQIFTKTRHVGDLWETAMALWGHIFTASNPADYIRSSDPTLLLKSSPRPVSDSANDKAVSRRVSERFQIDFKAVKIATQHILVMPATHVLKVQGPSRRKSKSTSDVEQIVRSARMETEKGASAFTSSTEIRSMEMVTLSKGLLNRSLRSDLQQAVPEDVNHFIDTNLRKYCQHTSAYEHQNGRTFCK